MPCSDQVSGFIVERGSACGSAAKDITCQVVLCMMNRQPKYIKQSFSLHGRKNGTVVLKEPHLHLSYEKLA